MGGLTLILLMFVFIAIGMPITFSLGVSSLLFFFTNKLSLMIFIQKMSNSIDSFSMLALPFFILAGDLMNSGGVTKRLFNFINNILGSIRGGLSYVCILTNAIFSAISGSSLANAAGIGTMVTKAMDEKNYDHDFSTCLVTSSSILGPIIPPSVIMIVYGVTAGVSISRMFMGGVIPGILYCLILGAYCFFMGKKLNLPKGEKFEFKKAVLSFKEAIWALLMPVIILGGIFGGIFTATESGAIACVYGIIIGKFVYKDLSWKDLVHTFYKSAKTTGNIMIITATGALFAFCLTYARIPQAVAATLSSVISSKVIMMMLFTVVYLFLGCIMSAQPIVITTVPIFAPVCTALGIDLIYFGVFIGILMSIGTATPPVGTVMFVMCKNRGISIEHYTKKMIPFFVLIVLFCLLLVLFPSIVTFLPNYILNK
jgi:tripartite ATP-independent transporter DctM subunit